MSQKSKRILVLCPKGDINAGGIISNFELLKYLKEKGYQLRVITSWEGTYNKALTKAGISNRTIAYNWWTPGDTPENISSRVMSGTVEIVKEITSFSPDVVVTNTSHIPWGAFAASMTNTPHIWIVREFPINNFEYLAEKVEFIHRYSNKIMANSAELAEFYQKEYGYDTGNFMSYVDVGDIVLGESKSRATYLVSPNYISRTKNQIELVNAAVILRSRRPDLKFKLLLMGEKDVAYWPTLKKAIEKSGLQDILTIYDRVDKPWTKVTKNDILIQTSLSESIGRTTTEAMKIGVPVIATDIPGHREAFSMGDGVLYELGNPIDLASKIEWMLDNPAERKKVAASARSRSLKNMSKEASCRPFITAINEVIDQDNPMGVNAVMLPYFQYYVDRAVEREEELTLKTNEAVQLSNTVNELRGSRSYKLGKAQTDIVKKVLSIGKRGKRK